MTATAQHTPFREDRQFGEAYADNAQVYRTIDITHAQLQRLPVWTRLAIAKADAAQSKLAADNAALLAALEAFEQYGRNVAYDHHGQLRPQNSTLVALCEQARAAIEQAGA